MPKPPGSLSVRRSELATVAAIAAVAAGLAPEPARADEAGICGQWTGEIMYVLDSGDAQTWAQNFSAGDTLRGAFMKRGVPVQISTTENTTPWHQHVNTSELFTDHANWAMNVNVNGFSFEQDSRTPVTGAHRMGVRRRDTTRNPLYGDRHDHIAWWTDWVNVSEEIEYLGRYHISVRFEGSDSMLQTPNGVSAGAADLQPDWLGHLFGSLGVEDSYGVVQLRAYGGFDGNAQVTGRITEVQPFPCSWVHFDAETGRYSARPEAGVEPGRGDDSPAQGGPASASPAGASTDDGDSAHGAESAGN